MYSMAWPSTTTAESMPLMDAIGHPMDITSAFVINVSNSSNATFGSAINTACQTPTAMPRTSSTRNCPTADGMPGAPWCSMSTEAARNPRKAIWWFFVRGYSIVTAMSPSLHPYPTIPWKLRSRIRDPGAKPAPATRWFAQKTIGSLNIRDSWAGYDFLPQKPNHLRPWNLYGLPCSCAR